MMTRDDTFAPAGPGESRGARIAGAIYGTLLATAVVAGLSGNASVSAGRGLAAVIVTNVVFWVAHAYADLVALRLECRVRPGRAAVMAILSKEWPMVQSAWPASAILLLGWIGVLQRDTSYSLAIDAGIVAMAVWGLTYAKREGARWPGMILSALVNVALGLVVVALKVLVTH
jgi:hypothetical protein